MQESNLQIWEGMDLDVLDFQDKEVRTASQSEFWKPEVGENPIRYLPKLKGWRSNARIIYEHYVDDVPGYDGTVRFVCPRSMTKGKQRCPECERADTMKKNGNPVDFDRAKKIYPQTRVYTNIIDRAAEELGPRVYSFGKTVWEKLKKIASSKHQGGDYTNPTASGFDVVIDRTGTGKNDTRYDVFAAREDSALAPTQEEMVVMIENQWNLDYYAAVLDGEELMKLLRGESRGRGGRRVVDGGDNNRRQLTEGRDTGRGRGRGRTAQDDVERGGRVVDAEYAEVEDDGTGEPPL